jgi:hypothetical protein
MLLTSCSDHQSLTQLIKNSMSLKDILIFENWFESYTIMLAFAKLSPSFKASIA